LTVRMKVQAGLD